MARSSTKLQDPAAMEDDGKSFVRSLRKALSLTEVVAAAERPLTVAELAIRAGIVRPTAYRLVQTLVASSYLSQNPVDGRISVGLAVLPLAASVLDNNRMRVEALPHLHTLAQRTGERVNLGILHRNQVLYIAGVEKPSLPTIYSRFGKTTPANCCSLGKAILAHMPEGEIRRFLDTTPLVASTENSIATMPAFLAELGEIRRRGYATDRAENTLGSYCVAFAIFDRGNRPIGAIGLSGRSLEALIPHAEMAHHTAEVLSHVL